MTPPSRSPLLKALMLASVGSGCAALLNQILWTRILSLVFGSTIESVSIVTAVFMAGLALGSVWGPRLVRSREPAEAVSLYMRIEIAIGASGVLLAFLLPSLESFRASAGAAPVWTIAIVSLLVPTTLMGTTLVIQAHAASASGNDSRASRSSGLLFAANTVGAALGAYGSVILLIPSIGIRNSIFLAAALNISAAMAAFAAGRLIAQAARARELPEAGVEVRPGTRRPLKGSVREGVKQDSSAAVPESALALGAVLFAFVAAGFSGLANEVAWTRAFILIAGPTVHAFAFVLGAIVLGLASGAFLSSGLLLRFANPRLVFALTQSALGLSCAFIIRSFSTMPLPYGEDVRRLVESPSALIDLQAWRAFALLAPAAAFSGALFPLGLRLLSPRFKPSEAMGLGSALNTAGAIAGALASGFFLLPGIGLDATLRVAAMISVRVHSREFIS